MAEFKPAFTQMIRNEGGYKLHTVEGDRGGMTYAGIARNFHPTWEGWVLIDGGFTKTRQIQELVQNFYKSLFWNQVHGDAIVNQDIATTIFDFAVNTGVKTAAKLAQALVKVKPDGVIGPKSVKALNKVDPDMFVIGYAVAKIHRYARICNRNKSQSKFLLGWINRTLKSLNFLR